MDRGQSPPSSDTIQPFRMNVPQMEVDDLRDRLARTRWPAHLPETGWDRGVPFEYLKKLAEYGEKITNGVSMKESSTSTLNISPRLTVRLYTSSTSNLLNQTPHRCYCYMAGQDPLLNF